MFKRSLSVITIGMALSCASAQAAPVMPDFGTVPAGWTTDRYAPDSFANVGSYQGRSDVLGIGISSAQDTSNRPAAYKNGFYNTQGMGHAISGGAGSVLSADLYIPLAWRDAANGNVRTDMWGVMSDAGNAVSDYPIIGFTNYGQGARLRAWDSDVGWVDLAYAPVFDSWMSLAIEFTGSAYVYSINGTQVLTDTTVNGATHFSSVLMQAFNFGDPSITGANAADYTAYWSNTSVAAVPEPGSLALMALAMASMGAASRRSRKNPRG